MSKASYSPRPAMTDTNALYNVIRSKGFKLGVLSRRVGITPNTLRSKITNDSCFTVPEMYRIVRILGLSAAETERLFFHDKEVQ